jgi:hypothetical protein
MTGPHLEETTKQIIDAMSILTVLGSLMQILPSIAALFTIIWTAIRIFETKTIQGLIFGDDKEEDNGN